MSAWKSQTLSPPYPSHPTLRRRILRMATVWAALGAVMGASVGRESGGLIGAIAGMMAGIVELALLGSIFTLIGGRPKETILGAVGGLIVGLAIGMPGGQVPVVRAAVFGLLVGAMAGATLRAYIRLLSLPIVLLGRILRTRHRHPAT
jgi:hypothetical protein